MPGNEIHARFRLPLADFALDVDLALPGRGVTAIFGSSGSGKTSLLRCVAGLVRAPVGELSLNGEKWQGEGVFRQPHKRSIGYVFQEASLFPHMTVGENLRYGIRRRAPARGHRQAHVDISSMAKHLGVDGLLGRTPDRLSGGERQRIAIARALLTDPDLVLMDEPLASLDYARKQEILPWLQRLCSEFDTPVLYVSHSVDEVARLADHVVVLEDGRSVFSGPLEEGLAGFDFPLPVGEERGAVLGATIVDHDRTWDLTRVSIQGGAGTDTDLWIQGQFDLSPGAPVRVRVLARDISLALVPHRDTSIQNVLPVTIDAVSAPTPKGALLVRLRIGRSKLVAQVTRKSAAHLQLGENKQIWAQIKAVAVIR